MGRHTTPHSGKRYQPTPELRQRVLMLTGLGIEQRELARLLQIDPKTLRLHFRRELDIGMTEANVRVAQALYRNATQNGNVTTQIWWTKTPMGWREAAGPDAAAKGTPVVLNIRWADAVPAAPASPVIEHDEQTRG